MSNTEKQHEFFSRVAKQVDALVIKDSIRGEFQRQIRPFTRAWEKHWSHKERYERRRRKYSQFVKRNPRLQDKAAGPPKTGWVWDTKYFLDEEREMPARYAEDVLSGIEQCLDTVYSEMHEMAMLGMYSVASKTLPYQSNELLIEGHKKSVIEIQEQLSKLSTEERETAWISAPPLERLFWWQYLDLSSEEIFGCWRPPLKKIQPNPIEKLIPQYLHTEFGMPLESPDVPPADTKTEEYERYYVILTSIHDKILTGCSSISKGIWSDDVAFIVWHCITKGRRMNRDFIEIALTRVEKDLVDKGLTQNQTSDNVPIEQSEKETIEINIDQFSKGPSKQLLRDLASCPSGVTYNEKDHGKNQPKILKERLKAKGYDSFTNFFHKNGKYIFCDKKITLSLKNNTP